MDDVSVDPFHTMEIVALNVRGNMLEKVVIKINEQVNDIASIIELVDIKKLVANYSVEVVQIPVRMERILMNALED